MDLILDQGIPIVLIIDSKCQSPELQINNYPSKFMDSELEQDFKSMGTETATATTAFTAIKVIL